MRPPDLLRPSSDSRRRPDAGTRRRLSAAPSGNRADQPACTVLGPTHPLTRASDALARVVRQWWICAAILTGAAAAQLESHPWATALIVSAAVVLLALTAVLLALHQRVCDCARDLISDGWETLPIAIVQRQRDQLLSQRRRKALAQTLETMIWRATNPPWIISKGARPLFDARVIRCVAPDLRAVIRLLETEQSRALGVSILDRLMTDGRSPLYGQAASLLREELQRVQRALEESEQ